MSTGPSASWRFRLAVRIDDVAGLVLRRPQDDLPAAIAKLLEIVGRNVLELCEEQARFGPLAVAAERNVSDDRLETMAADVLGPLVIVEAVRLLDRLGQYLTRSVTEGDEVGPERINSQGGSLRLISLQEVGSAGKI